MKYPMFRAFSLMMIFGLLLAACGPVVLPAQTKEAVPQESG